MHLSLVPWSYGFLGISMICVSAFNAVGKPDTRYDRVDDPHHHHLCPAGVPAGVHLLELRGVFLAAFLANIIAGLLGWAWFRVAMKAYTTEPICDC